MRAGQPDVDVIPLVDLAWQHREVAANVDAGFERVMARGDFVNGADVAAFEDEFARYSDVPHCVAVANGTDAIELALRAVGISPSDEVILPANSFVATAEAVARVGATVVLVDCDPEHHLIDVEQVGARLGPRTRAVIPVHLFGQVAPMSELLALTLGLEVVLVEDAAQAHGATQHGGTAGSFGAAAGVSFYPGKNLGAYGDGGAVLTGSDDIAARVRAMRNHGGEAKYEHGALGWNSRLDTLQAVVLRAKLRRLAGWNGARAVAAERYRELLAGIEGIRCPSVRPGNGHVWHLYVIRVADRDHVLAELNAAGIGASIHYPVPIHLLEPFRSAGSGEGSFPVAERDAREILSLPLFPGITFDQQQRVADLLRKVVD